MARILRTCTPHSPPKHDVLRSTDVLHSTDRAHRGPRFASPGLAYFQEGGERLLSTWVYSNSRSTPTQRELDLQVSCAKRHRSAAQEQDKDRDVNKGDEEDVCNTRMKSMTSRWSNTTHEEEHDANDNDDEDQDQDTPPMRFSS